MAEGAAARAARRGRRRRGAARAGDRLPHAAPARRLLLDRHAGADRRAADDVRQLGIHRRRPRHLARAAGDGAVLRELRAVRVRGDGHPGRARGGDRVVHRALVDRARVRGHPRQRGSRRVHGRADAAAQAPGHHRQRHAHGTGRRAVSVLHHLRRAGVGVRPELRGEQPGHADDRRHHDVGGTGHRRRAARQRAADRDRHDLVGAEPPARRRHPGGVRDPGARGDRGARAPPEPSRPRVSAEVFLDVQSVTKRFGGFAALNGVSLSVRRGERFGLIGPNGSGKTTLINCVSGTLRADGGRIVFGDQDITTLPAHRRTRLGIARSFQIPKPFMSMTVVDNLLIPLEYAAGGHGAAAMDEAMSILRLMGLDAKARVRSGALTQIEMRKLELARAMAARPKLLVSDEAMAGLSSNEVDDILAILFRLNETGITVIMIEHIMRAVMRFSERIAVLDAGEKIAEGGPDQILADKRVEKAYLGE
ncbi:MAG: ABC transporter ATP-binding protein [Candidatus Rokubacteria bacterium]|nr:ABC transporter ATP-binding protein [Candidatus Rokubacteria bacterium]